MIIFNISAALILIIFIISLLVLRRNNKVADFRTYILDLISQTASRRIYAGRTDWKETYNLLDKYSYKNMLYSFRPLKLKKWFTEEEIEILKEGQQK